MRMGSLERPPAVTEGMPQAGVHAAARIFENMVVDQDGAIAHD
jgi:hypothetical protein